MADSPYSIAKAFERIENTLLDSMMRNFKRHRAEETAEGYNWTAWQAEQLKALNEYKKRNRAVFPKQFAEINQKIDELIDTTAKDGEASAEAEILKAIRKGAKIPHKPTQGIQGEFFKLNDRKLDALIKATHSDFVKAEHAILRRADDIYRKAIFNAQAYANTGAGTYAQAVDMVVRDMMRAGLDCVEYKNGARHTLSNYAEMAIRTANKRANLMGEGNKRAEWGIHTVVVNHRYGACALCAPFVGKIFIDDVYSGGKKGDGNYPLLSNAIREGLFHPNCKDGCSTWFEGISRIKPVTPEEEEEMNRREKLAARQNYYENQAEKCERIATHSLDKDNKKIYEHRAKINKQNAEKIAKTLEKISLSGIIKEQSKKPITKITDKSINSVPKVKVSGYSDDECTEIQYWHKELLKFSRDNNSSNEVAFVFSNGFVNPKKYRGADDEIYFGHLSGSNLFVMHNHPRNSSFSATDIRFLLNPNYQNIKSFSIIKNNGSIEIITKTANFDANLLKTDFIRILKKSIKTETEQEFDKAVKKLLTKHSQQGGMIEWIIRS